MTPIRKPVTRMSDAMVRSTGKKKMRRLVATLGPGDVVVLRPEGLRQEFAVHLLDIWSLAMKHEAARIVAERKKKRAERRRT